MTVPGGLISLSTVRADYAATLGGTPPTNMSALESAYHLGGLVSLSSFRGQSTYIPMSLSFNPGSIIHGVTVRPGNSATVTGSSIVTVSNGSGGYTYSWTPVSGSGISFSGANTNTLSVSLTGSPTKIASETFQCTVTDSTGHSVSGQVSVNLSIESNL